LVTHESEIAGYAGRILTFRDGRVLGDEPVSAPRDAGETLAALPEEAVA
jgi:putative ABC transport system ATP-binding protein